MLEKRKELRAPRIIVILHDGARKSRFLPFIAHASGEAGLSLSRQATGTCAFLCRNLVRRQLAGSSRLLAAMIATLRVAGALARFLIIERRRGKRPLAGGES